MIKALAEKYPFPWVRKEAGGLVRILDAKGNGIAVTDPGSNNDILWFGIVAAVNFANDKLLT